MVEHAQKVGSLPRVDRTGHGSATLTRPYRRKSYKPSDEFYANFKAAYPFLRRPTGTPREQLVQHAASTIERLPTFHATAKADVSAALEKAFTSEEIEFQRHPFESNDRGDGESSKSQERIDTPANTEAAFENNAAVGAHWDLVSITPESNPPLTDMEMDERCPSALFKTSIQLDIDNSSASSDDTTLNSSRLDGMDSRPESVAA